MHGEKAQFEVLSHECARILQRQGWRAADLHVHTLCSPDVIAAPPLHPAALYDQALNMGMDFVTFTDHDTMDAYDILGWEKERLVTGVEIRIKDMRQVGHTIHINVYNLDHRQFQEIEEIAGQGDLGDLLAFLRRCDLPFIYNHPLWFEPKEKPNLAAIPELVKLFPVVEYNMYSLKRKNEMVMELARRHGRGIAASTDTHSGMPGEVYTLSRGGCFREFFNNIRNGNSYVVGKDLTKQDLVQEINAWIALIFGPQDVLQCARDFSTGFAYLDRLVKALGSETLRGFPRIRRAALQASYRISNSGVPASLYLRSEGTHLSEIEKHMSMVAK